MTNAIDALRIQNRDKRLTDYQAELAALRADNARLREALEAYVAAVDAIPSYGKDEVMGGLAQRQILRSKGRAALAKGAE